MKTISKDTMEYWAFVSQIASAVAVVLSLIYVAVQVRENTKLLRSQAHYNALSIGHQPFEIMMSNESLSNAMQACNEESQVVTPAQWRHCGTLLLMQFNVWEYTYYQYLDDSIPKQLWVGTDAFYKGLIRQDSSRRRFWAEYQHAFDEPFRSYVSAEFTKMETTPKEPVRN